MSRWYRAYADQYRNPKVAMLSDREFRLWHNLLCVAAENDGVIPSLPELKVILKVRLDHLSTGVERLLSMGLIDRLGDAYAPHNWDKRQYKSDTSTERVHKHRAKRNVSVTPPETETETEKYSEPKGSSSAVGYAFSGRVIRLKQPDLDRWRAAYHAIPDIVAELTSIDAWLQGQAEAQRKRWFHSVPGMLGRKHQEALAAKKGRVDYRREPMRV